jgi:hypothetical protein
MSDQMDYKQIKGTPIIQALSVTPTTPPGVGYLYLYPKADNLFYQMDSSGNETLIDQDTIIYLFETRILLQSLMIDLIKQGFKPLNNLLKTELKRIS